MLRDVEDMSTTEAAEVLEITEDNVKSAYIERERCYARVFMRVLEWNGKKHLAFMPCGVIEWLRTSLKEFSSWP